jgi:hypothetical protein
MHSRRSVLPRATSAGACEGDLARRLLPWLLLLYSGASLLHFAHNAEYLAAYPNLPPGCSRHAVYLAWCAVAAVGLAGWLLYRGGWRRAGHGLLALYACLGFAGLLHYLRAPFHRHGAVMNLTILAEVATALVLLLDVGWLARTRAVTHG